MFITLVPAYGRDYKSGKAAKEDFNANKDFKTAGFMDAGQLINKEQIKPGTTVNIRYKRLTQIAQIKL